jgi:hypothetical protein
MGEGNCRLARRGDRLPSNRLWRGLSVGHGTGHPIEGFPFGISRYSFEFGGDGPWNGTATEASAPLRRAYQLGSIFHPAVSPSISIGADLTDSPPAVP